MGGRGIAEKKPPLQEDFTREPNNQLGQKPADKTNPPQKAFNLKETAIIVTSDKDKGNSKSSLADSRPTSASQRGKLSGGDASRSTHAKSASGKPPAGPPSKLAQGQLQEDDQLVSQREVVPEVPQEKLIRDSIDVPGIMAHGGDLS